MDEILRVGIKNSKKMRAQKILKIGEIFFLKAINKINKKYHTKIPINAVNKQIVPFAISFIKKCF